MTTETYPDPDDFEGLKRAMDDAVDVKVPPTRKTSLSSAVGFILASIFFLLFFVAISQFYGLLIAYITGAFSIFGWDPLVTSLFMSLFFLFLGVTIYVLSRRGNEAVSKMEAGLRIMFKNPPTRFYDLSEVPAANIVRELVGANNPKSKDKGRGCTMIPHESGNGFDIKCPYIPMTRAMKLLKEGKIDVVEVKQKAVITGVFLVICALLVIVTYFEVLIGIAMWILWIIFLFSFFYVMMELRIFKLWSAVIAWLGFNIFFTAFVTDPYFLWTMWGAWICALIIAGIFYVIYKNSCVKKKSWYCPFL